jgi:sugar lactone lactonase YvrE
MRLAAAFYSVALMFAAALQANPCVAAPRSRVVIEGTLIFPESITSTSDGTLIIGSIGLGSVFRAKPGAVTAQPWIPSGSNGLLSVFGVLADERSRTLWVCSSEASNSSIQAPPGQPTGALLSFDLKTGAPKRHLPFPEPNRSLCNDIAVGSDGSVYATDTRNDRILRLKKGGSALEVWLQSELIKGGVDGIAFLDSKTLYLNTIGSGHLFRISLLPDGSPGAIRQLQTSQPLGHPDGMRAAGAKQLLLAEGAGRADLVTISGDVAQIKTLRDGLMTPCGVTAIGAMAWIIEGKFTFRTDPKLKDQDPGEFYAFAVPWRNR